MQFPISLSDVIKINTTVISNLRHEQNNKRQHFSVQQKGDGDDVNLKKMRRHAHTYILLH